MPGSDADIAVLDPESEWTVHASDLHSNCDFSPYESFAVQGKVWATLSKGAFVWKNGTFEGRRGHGSFLPR